MMGKAFGGRSPDDRQNKICDLFQGRHEASKDRASYSINDSGFSRMGVYG